MQPAVRGARRRGGTAGWPRALATAGLVLVVGLALLVLVVWALGLVAKSGPVHALDRPAYHWFVSHRAGWATAVMNRVTGIGDYAVTGTVSAVAALGLALWRRRVLPLLLLVAVPLEKYLQQWIGSLVGAPRPPAAQAIGPVGSFPSGGSARVLVVGAMVAFLLARAVRDRRVTVAVWTVVALAALVEGWSRLYLGRHWVGDVLGGWVLGALLAVVLLAAARPLSRGRLAPPP